MTAEEKINGMCEIMPFHLSENIKPYIIEAMKSYTDAKLKDALIDYTNKLMKGNFNHIHEVSLKVDTFLSNCTP